MKDLHLVRNLSARSLFSGSALAMAISLLSVIVLLIWWQHLLSKNLEIQYQFLRVELENAVGKPNLKAYVRELDEKLAIELFPIGERPLNSAEISRRIDQRLANRKRMVQYEQIFFILLLLSGHIFFLYVFYRERQMRKQTEETVLLATHELRQPLQSLTLALDTLAFKSTGSVKRAISGGLADIERLSSHIKWLSNSFLHHNDDNAHLNITNMRDYFVNLVQREFSIEDRQRINATMISESSANLRIADEALRFALRNLLENSLRYGTGAVLCSTRIDTKGFCIQVANKTKNLDQKTFARLGNAFFRAADATVQNTGGFGVGLYLTGRILRKAGGSLTISHAAGTVSAEMRLKCQ